MRAREGRAVGARGAGAGGGERAARAGGHDEHAAVLAGEAAQDAGGEPRPRRRQPRHPPRPARRHLQTCRREDMTTKFSTILPQLLPSETLCKEALTLFLAIHTLFRSQTSNDPEPLSVISLT